MQWYINCLNSPSLHLNSSRALFRCKCTCKFAVFKFSSKLSNCTIFMLEEGITPSGCSYLRGKCAPGGAPLVVFLGRPADWGTSRSMPLSFLVPTPGLHLMKTQAQKTWIALRTQILSKCPGIRKPHPGPGSTPRPQSAGGVSRSISQRRRYSVHFGKGKAHADIDSNVTGGHVCK